MTKYLLPTSAATKEVQSAQQEMASQQASQSMEGGASPKKGDSKVIKVADHGKLTTNLLEKLYEGERLANIGKTADKLKTYVSDYGLSVSPIVEKVMEKAVD